MGDRMHSKIRTGRPNCWNCRYFTISWHPSMTYACRLMGFKSKILPCKEVKAVDGRSCQGFLQKNRITDRKTQVSSTSDIWLA